MEESPRFAWWVVAWACLLSGTAHAENVQPDAATLRRMLHVQPGATCLTADALAAEIPEWLHGDALATDVAVWVDGSPTDPRAVHIRLIRAGEELSRRAFDPGPAACAELRSAVSLSIAMALRASIPETSTHPPPPPSPLPTTTERKLALFVGGLTVFRLLPEALAGPEMRVGLALGRHVFIRVGALGVMARTVPLPETSVQFDTYLVAARTAACGRITLVGPLAGHACAGMIGGGLLVRGRDESAPPRQTLAWAALTSEIGLTVAASDHLVFTAEPGLVVPLRAVHIGIVDANDVVVTAISLRAIAISLGLGAAYRF